MNRRKALLALHLGGATLGKQGESGDGEQGAAEDDDDRSGQSQLAENPGEAEKQRAQMQGEECLTPVHARRTLPVLRNDMGWKYCHWMMCIGAS